MNKAIKLQIVTLVAATCLLSACVVRPVVATNGHGHNGHAKAHVIHHQKHATKKCWRHNGHWDCK